MISTPGIIFGGYLASQVSTDPDFDTASHPISRRPGEKKSILLSTKPPPPPPTTSPPYSPSSQKQRPKHQKGKRNPPQNLPIVINLHLRPRPHHLLTQPQAQIPRPIPTAPLQAPPLLNPRPHHLHQRPEQMPHRLPFHVHAQRDRLPRLLRKRRAADDLALLGKVHLRPPARHGLQHHARDVQVRAVVRGGPHDGRDGDARYGGHGAVRDRRREQGQVRRPAGFAQRPVGVVGGGVVPGTEALRGREPGGAGGDVRVAEGHEVGAQGGGVGLGEAREGEGAWVEEARVGGGGGRGAVRVEGAAVEAGRAEAVAGGGLVVGRMGAWGGGKGTERGGAGLCGRGRERRGRRRRFGRRWGRGCRVRRTWRRVCRFGKRKLEQVPRRSTRIGG